METVEKSFPVDRTQPVMFSFENNDGDLRFSVWEKDLVEVRVKKEVRTANEKRARRLLEDTEVQFSQNKNSIRVRIRYPRRRGYFLRISPSQRVKVSTEVMLPAASHLRCEMDDGTIYGGGVRGDLNLHVDDGSIRVSRIQGFIRASCDDGRVILEDIEGGADVACDDADIRISGTLGRLRIRTDDGDIDIEVRAPSAMEEDWEVTADDGDVTLYVSETFSAGLAFSTDNGKISSELPVALKGLVSRTRFSGTLNQGGHLIRIKTDDGNISLKKGNGDFPLR